MAAPMPDRIERLLQDLKQQYCKLVRNNPETVSQIESTIRIISFLVAGRLENGQVISELIYSASNLLVFINDNVFKAASKYIPKLDISKEKIKQWVTVIEYLEVFIEMVAQKRWGNIGAWVVITVIQIAKTILRFYLLLQLDAGMQPTPPINPVDRQAILPKPNEAPDKLEDVFEKEEDAMSESNTYMLSTGRRIRTLDSAPSITRRTWSSPNLKQLAASQPMDRQRNMLYPQPSPLRKQRLWAECLHVARPLTHLLSMYVCGRESWKPYLLACGMDVSSLCLMGETEDLNVREKSELRRRSILLLYYLLRSPFYDNYSKAKIIIVLRLIADHVPLSGLLLRPLIEYLPIWQKIYFYVWAT